VSSMKHGSVASAAIGEGDALVIVEGDLDVATAPQFYAVIAELLAGGQRRLVIDLTDATFLDTTGIGMLFLAIAPLRDDPGSSVMLVGAHGVVARTLEDTGIGTLFRCVATRHAAIDDLHIADQHDGWRSVLARASA